MLKKKKKVSPQGTQKLFVVIAIKQTMSQV